MNVVQYENVTFTVLNVEERRIGKIRVEVAPLNRDEKQGEKEL